jgi:hypothetical protein
MLTNKLFVLVALVTVILISLTNAYSLTNSSNNSNRNATIELLEKGSNVTMQFFNNLTNKVLDKEVVQQISYFSDIAADFLSEHLNLTPAEAKLLEYYIFVLIIVLLAEYIAKFGKFVLLVFGLLIGGLIIYNDPQNMIWGLIIVAISVLYWYKK